MRTYFVLLFCLLAGIGCGRQKSTEMLLQELKASDGEERTGAARQLARHKGDAATVVPALIEALKDKDASVRQSAALGLGSFGDKARDAIPALQAAQTDRDVRVREAARIALSRIDPQGDHAPAK